jgi:zinc protease
MMKHNSFVQVLLAAIAVGATSICWAAPPAIPQGFTHIRTVKGISEYRLDSNGLTVLLLPDHSAPAVTFMVTYRVGSRNESYGTTGATHLLEHLMFKGTKEHNKNIGNGYDQLLERTGAITNATTWLDRTNYYQTVGSQDLPLAVMLEADRMRNLRLLESDRRPEMTVVRNEYERGENDPAEALQKEMWAAAYIAHPYHHTTIGWHSDFEKVPIEKLRAFYDTFYWPNNATVSIIGDFEPAEALKLVKKYYGSIPKASHPIPQVYTEEPPQTGPRRVLVQRPGELGVVMIAQKIPPARNPDYAALRVLGLILSDGRNSRFYKALTDKNLTTNVDASPEFNHDPTLFFVNAQLTPGTKHADVEKRIIDEIERVKKDGVKDDEVAAAVAKYLASTAFQRDGSMAMAFALNECIAVGDWRLYYGLEDEVKKVTAADVERVAKKYFNEDQRTIGWFVPRNETPEEADQTAARGTTPPDLQTLEKSAKDGAKKEESAAKSNGHSAARPTASPRNETPSGAAPAVAKIAPRITRKRTAGIDLLVCPTGVKDVVRITGTLPAYNAENPILGELAAEMLERGTKKHDADTIAALLDKVGAQIGFAFDSGNIRFSAQCLKKDSKLVFDLLAEQLREPTFPKDEFEKLRKQKIAESQQLKESTDAQASIAFRRSVFKPGNPQYRLTPEERIAALEKAKVDDVKAFHEKYFGPEYATMVVVGDIEPAPIQSLVKSAFAGWKGGVAFPEPAAAKPLEAAKDLKVEVPGKESVSVIMGQPTGLRYADADFLPLSVGTNVLGRGFTGRLLSTVRDTEGLTYGIGADLSGSGKLDQVWAVVATFAPSLLKQGLASTNRELEKWHRDGITESELDYRKNALAGAHRVSLATSSGVAEVILSTVRRGLELSWIDEYPNKVAGLSLKQVNSAIKRYVDPDKLVVVRAGSIQKQTGSSSASTRDHSASPTRGNN